MENSPKDTSYEYGEAYQLEQVEKHRSRNNNHWKPRIQLVHELIDKRVLPKLEVDHQSEIKTLDVGCSIGTMAIEMALRGFISHGVDFDQAALKLAKQLTEEEKVHVEYFQCDVAELEGGKQQVYDIVVCFDIFEHLHDDELGALLQSIRRQLKPNGALVFYTFPLQYDYIFFSRDIIHWPLVPFKWLSKGKFERLVRAYAALLDIGLLLGVGKSYKDRIRKNSHCNPTTKDRLEKVLKRAGFSIDIIETTNLYPFKTHVKQRFIKQPIADRNLYGVAFPMA